MSKTIIQELTHRWVEGWNVGDRAFDGEAFRELFAPGANEIAVFDNVQGDVLVLTSVDQYVQTWGPFMAPMTHWSVKLKNLDIRVSGDLAVTTFKLVGNDTRGQNNEDIRFGQYGTHVWQRTDAHGWRIVHEHLTSYDRAKERAT